MAAVGARISDGPWPLRAPIDEPPVLPSHRNNFPAGQNVSKRIARLDGPVRTRETGRHAPAHPVPLSFSLRLFSA
jgi:hypothetical protein